MTAADLFTGGGGAAIGMSNAGLDVIWGIEYDEEVATVANHNLDHHVICADVLNVDPHALTPVDFLHASPPCPRFSLASSNRYETERDIAMGQKVAEFIRVIQPKVFTLENAYLYRKSESWRIIRETLEMEGYFVDFFHAISSDYGVPQKRRRMLAWGVRGQLNVPAPPKTHDQKGRKGLPKWNGWFGAIEDIIWDLDDDNLADWQERRLPDEITESLLIDGTEMRLEPKYTHRTANQPALAVKASIHKGMPKMLLVDGNVRRVKVATPRVLARFQTIPDSYSLPAGNSLACRIIGNAIPPLLMQRTVEHLSRYIVAQDVLRAA